MQRKAFSSLVQIVFMRAALTLVLASPALAAGGTLITNTVYQTITDQLYQSVTADIGGLNTAFPVDPAEPLTTGNRDALTNIALGNLSLDPSQIVNLLQQDIFLSTTSELQTSVDVTESPGAIVIGDPTDLANVQVVSGTLTVTTTETTLEHQNYNLNITGDLAPSAPVQTVPEPPTLWLMIAGLAGIAHMQRRRARRTSQHA